LHQTMDNPYGNGIIRRVLPLTPYQCASSFEELHAGRLYLLDCLQHADAKATDLLKNITNLQETLNGGVGCSARKRFKRQLAWARRRMRETTRLEKSILQRLGQIAYDIQRQERWTQVQEERMLRALQQIQLDPTCPEFTPAGSLSVRDDGGHITNCVPSEVVISDASPSTTNGSQLLCPSNGSGYSCPTSRSDYPFPTARGRSRSMPTLSLGRIEAEQVQGSQYVGYYISE